MNSRSRREFLAEVGRGMLVASLGATAALELGMTPCIAEEPSQRLTFGKLEPLVSLDAGDAAGKAAAAAGVAS